MNQYLRFHIWVEYGLFIPRGVEDIPFRSPPTEAQRAQLNQLDFSIKQVEEEEARRIGYPPSDVPVLRRKAHLVEEAAVAERWITIFEGG